MTVLIDADSLIYIIAWKYREFGDEQDVKRSCDNILRDIVTITQAEDYVGVFSDSPCFRHEVYKYAPYKGNRGDKPEWVTRWMGVITNYFMAKHGFVQVACLEADDVVSAGYFILKGFDNPCIICSPDKDLLNIPGLHYVPKKQQEGETMEGQLMNITEEQAHYSFWLQMICGDQTDNVAGVPGLGEVKGKKLLADCMDPMMYESVVQGAYVKYFGAYYGRQIFEQTKHTLMMLQPAHGLWDTYGPRVAALSDARRKLVTGVSIFDI